MNLTIFDKNIRQKMLKTIIVDDEEHVRATLQRFLVKYSPQVKVLAGAGSVAEAFEAINRHHPDLVLLDIQLGDGTGFDLLNKFESPDFKIVFITAHNQYAVQAFKVSALDFILKPVNPLELAKAVEQAQQAVQQELRIKLEALESNLDTDKRKSKKIVVNTLDKMHVLDIGTITHCGSDGDYTTIYTLGSGHIIASKTLKDYEDMLQGFGFFRIHRSFLINLAHIRRFEKGDGGFVILTNEHKIPVASRKRDELVGLLNELA
jgi:two-component system, LytTR family, response regulator